MSLVNWFVTVIAFIHFYFLILEMFLWTKPKGLKVFQHTLAHAQATAKLAANQGLYNGFLSAGLIWSVLVSNAEFAFSLKCFFLACVIVAGIYGAWSVTRKIFYVQALPAIITIAFVFLEGKL